jgi:DNA-binding transcriptional MerR regulator
VTIQTALKNSETPLFTLPELTEEFQISEDSFWDFEQTGLIRASHTEDGVLAYSEFQRARLRFVIYYDALGYSTADIVDTIGSVAGDSNEIRQIEESLSSCNEKIRELNSRIEQNSEKSLEQIDILCDHSILVRYIEEVETIYAAAIQSDAPAHTPAIHLLSEDARDEAPPQKTIPEGSVIHKIPGKKHTVKIAYVGLSMLLVFVVGYFHFSDSPTRAILPEQQRGERSIQFSETRSTTQNANGLVKKPANALKAYPFPADTPASPTETEKAVPRQSPTFQTMRSERPADSSQAPLKKETSEVLSVKTEGVNEAPPITPSKPEKSALPSGVNETPALENAQKSQAASPDRPSSLKADQTETLADAEPREEYLVSSRSPDPEVVPKKRLTAPKESSPNGSKESVVKTQTAFAEIKAPQEAHRDKSDAPKNTASGVPAERQRQTDEMQKGTENPLAEKTPNSPGLVPRGESETPINPNALEALDWLKKSNDSIARNDTLETIVTASVAIKLDPKLLQAYLNRAWAFNERALYDKAIMDLNHALQLDPGNAVVYTKRALIFQRKGDDPKAIADYEKACQLGLEIACENYQKFASLIRN